MRRTSSEAYASIADSLQAMQARVYRALFRSPVPLTDEQLQIRLGMSGNTQRPRRVELLERGLIEEAGVARTRSGHRAMTWRVKR